MPFLGKNPTAGFSTIVKDDLTPDGSTTAFTLSKNVASANDIAVFVGNVRQEPTDAYSVSGTTLTMTAAPSSGINFYVLHIAGTLESSVIPADNTISTAKLQNDSVTGAKLENNPTIAGNLIISGTTTATGKITSTAGITFGSDTLAENVLDDYEEGTWTVEMHDAVTGGNASSTTVTGYYTKIGNLVTARFYAMNNISTSGLTSGNVAYFTLPFAASSTGRSAGTCAYETINLGTGRTQITPTVSENRSVLQLTESGDHVTDQSITVGDFNGTSSDIVTLSITYATS